MQYIRMYNIGFSFQCTDFYTNNILVRFFPSYSMLYEYIFSGFFLLFCFCSPTFTPPRKYSKLPCECTITRALIFPVTDSTVYQCCCQNVSPFCIHFFCLSPRYNCLCLISTSHNIINSETGRCIE